MSHVVSNIDVVFDYNKRHWDFCLFKRDEKNSNVRYVDKTGRDFHPYFYVDENEDLREKKLDGLIKIELGHSTYDGHPVKKLVFKSIENNVFISARDKFTTTYEDDVVFLQRFIIDNDVKFAKEQRILCIDIETDNCNTPEDPKEITCITVYDSFLKYYVTFVWQQDLEEKYSKNSNHIIFYCNSEVSMLENFLRFLSSNWTDIITGWAIDFFDLPYIIHRMKRLNMNYRRLSQIGNVFTTIDKITKERYTYIAGSEILDMKELYKKIVYRKLPDYKLDTAAFVLFGEGKMETTDAGTLWRTDLKKLIEYNKKDVELCVRINESAALIDYFLGIQQVIPIKLRDVFQYSRVVDYHILRKYHNTYVFPSKRRNEKVDFAGGLVIDPIPGLHKNVAIVDASNMYSSIYLQFNLSPETLMPGGSGAIKVNNFSFVEPRIKKGLVPQIIGELLNERDRLKQLRDSFKNDINSYEYKKYSEIQGAVKGIINSFYGVLGYSNFRLFKPEISSTITFVGREMITWCKKYCESKGLKVIYLDTDGMMVVFSEKFTIEETIESARGLVTELNISFDEFVKQFGIGKNEYLQMKLEKVCSSMCFTEVKKKYFCRVMFENEMFTDYIYSRGFETSRRTTPLLFKKYLEKVYESIAKLQSYDEVFKLCKEIEKEIKTLGVYDIALPVSITKDINEYKVESFHIKAAKFSNLYLGADFKQSAVCRLVFVKRIERKGVPQADTILIDRESSLDGIIVDYDKHIEKLFYNKLQPIFDILRWKLPNDDQTVLTKWL